MREGFSVPLGLKGTIVAVHRATDSASDSDEMYDIVFDKEFPGGMTVNNCSDQKGYRLHATSFINISHGRRLMEQKTGVPGQLRALAKERQTTNSFQQVNSYSNSRGSNSAFASFNKVQQPPFITPNSFTRNRPSSNALDYRPTKDGNRPVQGHQVYQQQQQGIVNKPMNNFMPDFGRGNKENKGGAVSQIFF